MYNTMPGLMKWLPGPHQKIFSLIKKITEFVEIKIKEHKENFDPSSPRDYIDSFLIEMGEVSVLMGLFPVCSFASVIKYTKFIFMYIYILHKFNYRFMYIIRVNKNSFMRFERHFCIYIIYQ